MSTNDDGREALEELYWRSEILQAMYWMRGEELAADVDPEALAQFLVVDPDMLAGYMRRLAVDGYLDEVDGGDSDSLSPECAPRYRLSPLGSDEGGRSFAEEFAELTRPGHGECAPGCGCYSGKPCTHHPEVPRVA